MNMLYLLFIVELQLLIVAFYLSGKDIMAPAVMFCTIFCISIGLALTMIDQWKIDYSPESVLLLGSGTFIFVIMNLIVYRFMKQRLRRNNEGEKRAIKGMKPIRVQGWVIVIILVVDAITYIWFSQEIFRIVGYKGMSAFAEYREARAHIPNVSKAGLETTGLILNQFVRFVKVSGYIFGFILINNVLAGDKKKRIIFLSLVVFMSQLLYLFSAARSGMIKYASAILIEIYILWNRKEGWRKNLSGIFILIGIACVFLGVIFLYYGLPLFGRRTSSGPIQYIAKYAGSGVQLFDLYIKDPVYPVAFGEETFIGIRTLLSRLGFSVYIKDVNLEFRNSGLMNSNIYTFFRRPLHDFGVLGMYLFTMFVALLFSWIYYSKIFGRGQSCKNDLWILIYGYLYYWIISASTVQRSEEYFSIGAVVDLMVILVGYLLIRKYGKLRFNKNIGSIVLWNRSIGTNLEYLKNN